ncbi:MAG TPA: helix-turn-helix domain-containing protein [Candidatus Dormibacteraeota bacterium]|nr:helix-turn-helix domain-containing protein [Candidatus Dormibacteraeota bacterium]
MNSATRTLLHELETDIPDWRHPKQESDHSGGPRLVACVLLLPENAEILSDLFRNLAANAHLPEDLEVLTRPDRIPDAHPPDSWLTHPEAAEYLGISKSTLYRYACQERIECRKIAGRLEYRRSILDKLQQEQIRPARFPFRSRGIIRPALNSGK